MVHVQVAQVEGLSASLAAEVLVWAVHLLMGSQGAAGAEASKAGLTAERFDP